MNLVSSAINNKSIPDTLIQIIHDFPGIRYKELSRLTGLCNGVLSYYLKLLDNTGRVKINRINNRVTRYYSNDVSDEESTILGILRQNTTRKILIYILENGPCGFTNIVEYTNKVPSTVSWHLTKLKDANLIKIYKQNDCNRYDIFIDKMVLYNILSKYNASFNDVVIENYIEMLEEF